MGRSGAGQVGGKSEESGIFMSEEIRTEWRTARKRHCCDLCEAWIEPGARYYAYTGKYDGEIFTFKAHDKCWIIAQEIWDYVDPDEGITHDEFLEGCCDICRTFICKDCEKYEEDDCELSYCPDKLFALFQEKELYRDRRDETGASYWKLRYRTREAKP